LPENFEREEPVKKKLFLIITIAMILVLTMGSTVLGSSTTKNLATSFMLVNLTDTDATGSISYIKEDGSEWTGSSVTSFGPGQDYELPANGGSLQVRQYTDTISSGRGSVMISSDVQLGAVVQERLGTNDTSLPTSGAYIGVTEGSSKFFVPLAQSRRNTATGVGNTQIIVQNLDDSTIATITVTLYASDSNSTPATYTKTISNLASGASYFYDLADEANLNAGWNGSAVVDAGSGKIAVVVNSFNGVNGLRAYNAFSQESLTTKWAIPKFATILNNGLTTSVNVQNLSGATIPVGGIVLNCGSGAFTMENDKEIADKTTYSFNPAQNVPGTYPSNWEGACVVDSGSSDVVAFVVMRRLINNGDQAAYEALSYASTDTQVFFPNAAKMLSNGFATSLAVQNLSNEAATVDIIWTPNLDECQASPCNTYTQENISIPANGMLNLNLRTSTGGPSGMPSGWQGTAKVVPSDSANAKPIVGMAILSNYLVNNAGDNYRAHVALTLP
jgi:hypothetical protein